MDLSSEIARIEQAAAPRSISIRSILKRADLAPSNWARWKKGETSPSVKTWAKVLSAADSLLNAPRTPSADSTADRAFRSDQHPTPDTERSLVPGEAGASVAPAPGDVDEHSLQDPSEVRA